MKANQKVRYSMYCLLTLLLFLFNIPQCFAHEGAISPILSLALSKNYEYKDDGSESSVIQIQGLKHFGDQVVRGRQSTVVKFFGGRGSREVESRADFQQLAEAIKKNVRCVSVNFDSNEDVLYSLAQLLLKLIAQSNFISSVQPMLCNNVIKIINQLKRVQTNDFSVPTFYLFFKNSFLIFPNHMNTNMDSVNIDMLHMDIESQLLRENKTYADLDGNSLKHASKLSRWQKIKRSFKKIKQCFAKKTTSPKRIKKQSHALRLEKCDIATL